MCIFGFDLKKDIQHELPGASDTKGTWGGGGGQHGIVDVDKSISINRVN